MITVPSWWRAIGGPSAISRWSAVFTAGFIIPSGVWTAMYSSLDVGTALLVELIAAAIALPFLWLAHATWLSPRRAGERYRTPIALLTFFAVGLVRLFVMFGTRAAMGIDQPWSPWQSLITGGVYSIVVLSVVAVVVDAARSHARLMADMRQAEETLARARQIDADEAEALQRAFAEEVLREVRSGIERLVDRGDRVAMAEDLRTMSEELVRAGSHSLRDGDVVSRALAAPRSRVRFTDIVRDVRPAAPVLGPVGFEALVFTAVLRDLGGTIAVVNALLATSVLIAGNLVLRGLARRLWPAHGRLLVLAVAYFVVGLGAVASVGAAVTVLDGQTPALWVGAVSYTVFMVFFSAISSLRRGQEEIEGALAESIRDQAVELARVRGLMGEEQARLAHLMHGGLQSELTAAALMLSNQWETHGIAADPQQVIHDLPAEIDRHEGLVDGQQRVPELSDLVETWGMALDLQVAVDMEAEERLAGAAELRSRVVDVLSEALTNVVRHGAARRAWVEVAVCEGNSVMVTVRNPGHIVHGPLGLGSQELDEQCAEWSRTQQGSEVVLMGRLADRESAGRPVTLC